MEIQGRLIKIQPEQSGETWKKKEFVIETFGEYPKKICLSLWNDRIKMLDGVPIDSVSTVHFNAESREYNERWYTELKAYRVTKT